METRTMITARGVFYIHVTVNRDKFPYNKYQLDALISQIYFGNETLRVSHCSHVHHQELFTVHSAAVYVILLLLDSCLQTGMTYTIAECAVNNS
jgi:hypothetical protein